MAVSDRMIALYETAGFELIEADQASKTPDRLRPRRGRQ
jgi:hypothetical protein